MMQELLTKGIGHTGFKDSAIGRIPAPWSLVRLGDLVERESPICYGILMPGKHVPDGVPVVKVRDIRHGAIDLTNMLHTSKDIDEKYSRSRLRAGDLLLTIRGTTGRVAFVPEILSGGNITQDTARIRIRDQRVAEFLYFFLQGPAGQKQIASHTIGQAVQGINLEEVRRINVAVPPIEELVIVAGNFRSIEDRLLCLRAKTNHNVSLKKALMQDLLTGKVRVSVDA